MSSVSSLFNRGFGEATKSKKPKSCGLRRIPPQDKITLDSQQRDIVYSSADKIVVVAGAGSGKTRVLTERVKYLIDNGTPAHSIVAITFTNMAADEMRERLRGVDEIGDAFIGTIHSFANKIMKNSNREYTLFNDDIDNTYHRFLIEKYCHSLTLDRYLQYKDLKNDVEMGRLSESELKQFLLPSESAELHLIERPKKEIERERRMWYDEDTKSYIKGAPDSVYYKECIETLCERDNVIDFDTLLEYADEYFRSLNTHVEHLLVDELQDIGSLEYKFLTGLNASNSFFVGDDWQSIYGFKGASVNIFLNLVRDPNYTTYFLTNNYRNAEEILNLATTVIEQVPVKLAKDVGIMNTSPGEVKVLSKDNIDSILDLIQSDGRYREWFILVRTNQDIFKMCDLCREHGVPCETFKREGMSLADMKSKLYKNSVKILTVHTSKGLEVKNVVLYGKFPVRCPSYLNNPDERKVMYVGVTRAKEKLYVLN